MSIGKYQRCLSFQIEWIFKSKSFFMERFLFARRLAIACSEDKEVLTVNGEVTAAPYWFELWIQKVNPSFSVIGRGQQKQQLGKCTI